MSLSDHRPLRDKIYLKKSRIRSHNKNNKKKEKEKQRNTKRQYKETGKQQERTEKNKRRKGQEEERAQTLNLQILENLIQFIQSDLCGISDCENRSTETCRSGNEDYQPL